MFCLSANAVANCRNAALDAAAKGQSHLVITMEGLMGGVQGRAYRLARDIRLQQGGAYSIEAYSHVNGPSSGAQCAAIWKEIHGKNLRITVVGHSLGGGRAAMQLADRLAKQGITIDDLMILDGRTGQEITCGAGAGPKYQKPTNVVRATAIYQCGFMPGRTFEDGPGVTNIQADAGPLAHINLPGTSVAQNALSSILGRSSYREFSEPTVATEESPAVVESNNAEADESTEVEPARLLPVPKIQSAPSSSKFYIPRPGNMHISTYNSIINHPKANWPAKGCKPSVNPCTWARATIEGY